MTTEIPSYCENAGAPVPLIELRSLTRQFDPARSESIVLDEASLTIHEGSFTVIRGPSGAGKTTLLRILGLLDQSYVGTFVLDGTDISITTSADRDFIRSQNIGFVFQEGRFLNHLTLKENIALPLRLRGADTKTINAALKKVSMFAFREEELASGVLDKHPSEVSGGQKQRAGLARAIVASPKIILADEPTASLDSQSRSQVYEKLKQLHRDGTTVIVVSHDPIFFDYGSQLELKDRVIVPLSEERVSYGEPSQISSNFSAQTFFQSWWPKLKLKSFLAEVAVSIVRRPLLSTLTFVSLLAGIFQVAILVSLLGGVDQIIERAISDGSRLTRIEIRPRSADLSKEERFPLEEQVSSLPEVIDVVPRRSSSFTIISEGGQELPFQTIGLHKEDPELRLFEFLAGSPSSFVQNDFGIIATPSFLTDVIGISDSNTTQMNWSTVLGHEIKLAVPRFNRAGEKAGVVDVRLHVSAVILKGEGSREFYVSNSLLVATDLIKRDRTGSLELPLNNASTGWIDGVALAGLLDWSWEDVHQIYVNRVEDVVPVMTVLAGFGYRPEAEIWDFLWVLDLKRSALQIFVPLVMLLGAVIGMVLVGNIFISAKLREAELALCRVLGMGRADLILIELSALTLVACLAIILGLSGAQLMIQALSSQLAEQEAVLGWFADIERFQSTSLVFNPVRDFGFHLALGTVGLVLLAAVWPSLRVANIDPAKVFSR